MGAKETVGLFKYRVKYAETVDFRTVVVSLEQDYLS
jgi:hypothetical protein